MQSTYAVNLIPRIPGYATRDKKKIDPGNEVAYAVCFSLMLHVQVVKYMLNSSFWQVPI